MTRQELADHIRPLLPASWVVMPTAREFDVDSSVPCYVAIQRIRVVPSGQYSGWFRETYLAYVITPRQADDVSLDDELDDLLDETLLALDSDTTLVIQQATRDTYGQRQLHCWSVELEAAGQRTDAPIGKGKENGTGTS
jgi:hypothetical protein